MKSYASRLLELSQRLVAARASGELILQQGDLGFASAPSNIALIKYWGKQEGRRQEPANSSISLTLGALRSFTRVEVRGRFFPENSDYPRSRYYPFSLRIRGSNESCSPKMSAFLEELCSPWGEDISFAIESVNSFPTGCGVASSASGYAALVGAVADVLQLERRWPLEDVQYWISQWARLGSGSAARSSVMAAEGESPCVLWQRTEEGSVVVPFSEDGGMRHALLVLSDAPKSVSSSEGHRRSMAHPLQDIRLASIEYKLELLKNALSAQDWQRMITLVEEDAFALHSILLSSGVDFLSQGTSNLIAAFVQFRQQSGVRACWTLDAGPNVHVLYHGDDETLVKAWLQEQEVTRGIKIFTSASSRGLILGVSPEFPRELAP